MNNDDCTTTAPPASIVTGVLPGNDTFWVLRFSTRANKIFTSTCTHASKQGLIVCIPLSSHPPIHPSIHPSIHFEVSYRPFRLNVSNTQQSTTIFPNFVQLNQRNNEHNGNVETNAIEEASGSFFTRSLSTRINVHPNKWKPYSSYWCRLHWRFSTIYQMGKKASWGIGFWFSERHLTSWWKIITHWYYIYRWRTWWIIETQSLN